MCRTIGAIGMVGGRDGSILSIDVNGFSGIPNQDIWIYRNFFSFLFRRVLASKYVNVFYYIYLLYPIVGLVGLAF